MEVGPADIVKLVHQHRLRRSTEKILQADIEDVFTSKGVAFEREKRLTDAEIVDFLVVGGIAVEVKIKGAKPAIYGQCVRYCEHPDVTSLVLVTGVPMTLPSTILGKRAYVASLGMAFL